MQYTRITQLCSWGAEVYSEQTSEENDPVLTNINHSYSRPALKVKYLFMIKYILLADFY